MASDQDFVEFVRGQIEEAGSIAFRRMFGEYCVYCDGKVIGLICDNRFFVKPTEGGRVFIGSVSQAPAYPGARPSFVVDDHLDDREWMAELVRITVRELPVSVLPAGRRKRTAGSGKQRRSTSERR